MSFSTSSIGISGQRAPTSSGRSGYVKDREHVAGFRSHRFSQVPRTKEWEVARLELVSLLRHTEPAAYISERLPQMNG